ncbi:zinc finger protein 501-like [Thalassophryne amazonica]|uniref:zinc finger protein 501-like n=1 Tax=Thalassophryne amazonica TaxID=390379 RepID=UPI001471DE02|nr:zinc finger protein 501-like [Thalassophryne amazonica]
MVQVQLLRKLLKQRLTAADEELFELFERTIAEYDDEIGRLKEENKRFKVLEAVFKPEVRLYRAELQQKSVSKEDVSPEQQEWNLSLTQEEPKPLHDQEEEQHHWLEKANFTKFPFMVVVKMEDHEEELQSSRLYQNQTDDGAEAEPIASHTIECITPKVETDEGPQLANNSSPYCNLQPDAVGLSSDCSESETDDSYEWKQTRGPYSGFNCLTNSDFSVSDSSAGITRKLFNCSECETIFGHANYFRQYEKRQTSEKAVKCLECERCSQEGHLNIDRIHTGDKPFGCSECSKRFRNKSSLQVHVRIHTGEKPFRCFKCDKRCRTKSALKTHMRIHTGDKPFSCSDCGKRFRESGSLKRHFRIHTGDKPFGCSNCGDKFRERGSLKRHLRIHTGDKPFDCYRCGEKFREKCTLNTHMLIHTGEKPFVCSDCGKRFRQKGTMNKHIRIHTGEKPFGCSDCGKTFRERGHLNSHVKIHIREKQFDCSDS